MDVLYIITCILFLHKRTPVFSPRRTFLFLAMLFLSIYVHRRVVVEIKHVWLGNEIYQHNNVLILNIEFNDYCNSMCIRWLLSTVWGMAVQTTHVKKKQPFSLS